MHDQAANMLSRRDGYTLVEMLLVILILGISGALVIPHTSQARVLRIHAAVRTLVSDITYAQTDALAYQQRRALIFDEAANTYTVAEITVSTGGDVTYTPLFYAGGPSGQHVVDFNSGSFDGAHIRAVDFDGDGVLIFDEIGAPVLDAATDAAASLGTLYIEGPMSIFRIDVTPYTGQVVVQEVDALP
ncbi:MAG: prepilin-type N-terminal cleavage/methylation domain-containing protein [Planctomycetota bacterium]|nr:prepilin-type N-terminal cleavage/methylation domain-containing protein [Planctomycetota bacterium]